MTDSRSITLKWLRQVVQPYSHSDVVYNHVDAALSAYPTLRPKTDVYTYDDGRTELLLCIHGLLPIQYRGASYNIPVAVWINHKYPTQPPLVYVVPTSDMLVKAGKFVDISGWCEPAYIKAWSKKSEGCNLRVLLEILTEQFTQEPPVYAKPTVTSPARPRDMSPQVPPVPPSPDYSARPPPTVPRPNGSAVGLSSAPPPTPPRPAPVPGQSNFPPTGSPPSNVPHHSNVPRQNVFHPPRPTTSFDSARDPPIYSTPPTHVFSPPHSHGSPHYSSPPLQGPSHAQLHPNVVSPQRWPSLSGNTPIHVTVPRSPPLSSGLQPPAPSQNISSHSPIPPTHSVSGAQPSISQTPTRNYLDEDIEETTSPVPSTSAAPPRPPNPEVLNLHARVHAKLTAELTVFERTLAADMQRLQTAQSNLLAGEPAIRDEMARLRPVRDVCRAVAQRYRATVESAETNVQELRRKGDPEVDELICSTTIVYNQLINLVADDNAIEDTIYHLHRALNAGRIDLDRFLRTTRALAEEQFMKRALAEKIVNSIPMGAWR